MVQKGLERAFPGLSGGGGGGFQGAGKSLLVVRRPANRVPVRMKGTVRERMIERITMQNHQRKNSIGTRVVAVGRDFCTMLGILRACRDISNSNVAASQGFTRVRGRVGISGCAL